MDEKEHTEAPEQAAPEAAANEPMKVEKNTFMALLSYIGPLVIIPYLTAKDDGFVMFHIKQGLVLFVAEIALWFLMAMFWFLFPLWQLLNLVIFVFAIIGIVNALGGKEKTLPVVGRYAENFKI